MANYQVVLSDADYKVMQTYNVPYHVVSVALRERITGLNVNFLLHQYYYNNPGIIPIPDIAGRIAYGRATMETKIVANQYVQRPILQTVQEINQDGITNRNYDHSMRLIKRGIPYVKLGMDDSATITSGAKIPLDALEEHGLRPLNTSGNIIQTYIPNWIETDSHYLVKHSSMFTISWHFPPSAMGAGDINVFLNDEEYDHSIQATGTLMVYLESGDTVSFRNVSDGEIIIPAETCTVTIKVTP